MNLTNVANLILPLIKGLIPFGHQAVNETAERAVTIPAKVRAQWQSNMTAENKAQNESLWRKAFDALADALVHTASNGEVDPD